MAGQPNKILLRAGSELGIIVQGDIIEKSPAGSLLVSVNAPGEYPPIFWIEPDSGLTLETFEE